MGIGRINGNDDLGVRNFRDGKIIVQDGSGTPNQLELLGAEGDLNFTVADDAFLIYSRGVIVGRSQGDQQAMSISFTIKFEQWAYESVSDGISPYDAMKGKNNASSWVSTAACGPYSVDMIYQATNACAGAGLEQLVFPDTHFSSVNFAEGSEYNTISAQGTSLASEPTRTWVS